MKNFKNVIRLVAFFLFILLAASGLGIGSIFNTTERYADKEVTIEMVQKKDDEEEEDDQDQVKPK